MSVSKRVYLYGIQGLYNYGCEAMVRSISECIHDYYPNSTVIYESFDYERDKRILTDCGEVEIECAKINDHGYIKKAKRFIKRKIGVARPEDYLPFDTSWTRLCDALIVIGGDVFDLTPEQRNCKDYLNNRIFVSRLVKEHGGKVFLWGISVGDFDCNRNAKDVLINYFKNTVDFAVIRDEKSYKYLKECGVDNVVLCSDPAFIQRSLQADRSDKNVLGINLSPLANRYLLNNMSQEKWIEVWSQRISEISTALGFKSVLLIPHVVNPYLLRDDDESYLKLVNNHLKKIGLDSDVAPGNVGFLGIKKHIIRCDMVLAARMHCAVNSITCGVPTVFLSYSPKSIGMCEHVYNNANMVLDMNELAKGEGIDALKRIKKDKEKIQEFLQDKNIELMNNAKQAITYIRF